MNVSAVDQSTGSVRQRPGVQDARLDFDQLVQALQGGNLGAAQQAYSNFQQIQNSFMPSGGAGTAGAQTSGQSAVQNDWAALGQALQSGNLAQAQNTLGRLEDDAQGVWQSHVQQQIQNAQSLFALMQSSAQGAAALSQGNASTAGGAAQTDPNALGQNLQSSDTYAAQKLLAQLEQDIKSMSLTAQSNTSSGTGNNSSVFDQRHGSTASAAKTTTSASATPSTLGGPDASSIAKAAQTFAANVAHPAPPQMAQAMTAAEHASAATAMPQAPATHSMSTASASTAGNDAGSANAKNQHSRHASAADAALKHVA